MREKRDGRREREKERRSVSRCTHSSNTAMIGLGSSKLKPEEENSVWALMGVAASGPTPAVSSGAL